MTSDAGHSATLPAESEARAIEQQSQQQQPAAGGDAAANTSTTEKPHSARDNNNTAEERPRKSAAHQDSDEAPPAAAAASPADQPQQDNAPPLPDEPIPTAASSSSDPDAAAVTSAAPPLPDEAPPGDDGWEPVWDPTNQAYYFYNRFTKVTQWENPRVPTAPATASPGLGSHDRTGALIAPGTSSSPPPRRLHGGYNPAIHGSYDPNADYAKEAAADEEAMEREMAEAAAAGMAAQYVATGTFNRFTGKWQNTDVMNPDRFNDENKSRRQMNAFFDVDSAANSHDGRSLKAERAGKRLSKKEVKAYREKRREKKEEKRRAWLRD